jgi:hypothetical protein
MSQWRIATKQWTKFFFSMITRLLPLNMVRALFESSMEALHYRGPDFITRRTFARRGDMSPQHMLDPILPMPQELIGIILQGPLILQDDFTVETVKYYLSIQPQVRVIVSTWESENSKTLSLLKKLGAEVVVSQMPSVSGRSNVNRQSISTLEGLRKAKELGCYMVAKTRSDQRVNSLSALMSLPIYLEIFPISKHIISRKRLVALSFGTYKWTPFFLADQFMFGLTDDMIAYWEAPMDTETYHWRNEILMETATVHEYAKRSPEYFLLMAYLEKSNIKSDYTVLDWWQVLAEYFIIVDRAWLDIYWPKYSPFEERPELIHDNHKNFQSINHADWLNIYYSKICKQNF